MCVCKRLRGVFVPLLKSAFTRVYQGIKECAGGLYVCGPVYSSKNFDGLTQTFSRVRNISLVEAIVFRSSTLSDFNLYFFFHPPRVVYMHTVKEYYVIRIYICVSSTLSVRQVYIVVVVVSSAGIFAEYILTELFSVCFQCILSSDDGFQTNSLTNLKWNLPRNILRGEAFKEL